MSAPQSPPPFHMKQGHIGLTQTPSHHSPHFPPPPPPSFTTNNHHHNTTVSDTKLLDELSLLRQQLAQRDDEIAKRDAVINKQMAEMTKMMERMEQLEQTQQQQQQQILQSQQQQQQQQRAVFKQHFTFGQQPLSAQSLQYMTPNTNNTNENDKCLSPDDDTDPMRSSHIASVHISISSSSCSGSATTRRNSTTEPSAIDHSPLDNIDNELNEDGLRDTITPMVSILPSGQVINTPQITPVSSSSSVPPPPPPLPLDNNQQSTEMILETDSPSNQSSSSCQDHIVSPDTPTNQFPHNISQIPLDEQQLLNNNNNTNNNSNDNNNNNNNNSNNASNTSADGAAKVGQGQTSYAGSVTSITTAQRRELLKARREPRASVVFPIPKANVTIPPIPSDIHIKIHEGDHELDLLDVVKRGISPKNNLTTHPLITSSSLYFSPNQGTSALTGNQSTGESSLATQLSRMNSTLGQKDFDKLYVNQPNSLHTSVSSLHIQLQPTTRAGKSNINYALPDSTGKQAIVDGVTGNQISTQFSTDTMRSTRRASIVPGTPSYIPGNINPSSPVPHTNNLTVNVIPLETTTTSTLLDIYAPISPTAHSSSNAQSGTVNTTPGISNGGTALTRVHSRRASVTPVQPFGMSTTAHAAALANANYQNNLHVDTSPAATNSGQFQQQNALTPSSRHGTIPAQSPPQLQSSSRVSSVHHVQPSPSNSAKHTPLVLPNSNVIIATAPMGGSRPVSATSSSCSHITTPQPYQFSQHQIMETGRLSVGSKTSKSPPPLPPTMVASNTYNAAATTIARQASQYSSSSSVISTNVPTSHFPLSATCNTPNNNTSTFDNNNNNASNNNNNKHDDINQTSTPTGLPPPPPPLPSTNSAQPPPLPPSIQARTNSSIGSPLPPPLPLHLTNNDNNNNNNNSPIDLQQQQQTVGIMCPQDSGNADMDDMLMSPMANKYHQSPAPQSNSIKDITVVTSPTPLATTTTAATNATMLQRSSSTLATPSVVISTKFDAGAIAGAIQKNKYSTINRRASIAGAAPTLSAAHFQAVTAQVSSPRPV